MADWAVMLLLFGFVVVAVTLYDTRRQLIQTQDDLIETRNRLIETRDWVIENRKQLLGEPHAD